MVNRIIILIEVFSIDALIFTLELAFMAVEINVSTSRIIGVWILIAAMSFVICYS